MLFTDIEGMRRAGGKEVQETVDLCIYIADARKDWKIEGKRRRERQRMRWLDSLSDSMGIDLSKLWEWRTGKSGICSQWGCKG